MFNRILIVSACLCWPLANVAIAQQEMKVAPEGRQVTLLHLKHTDAGTVEKELSRMFASKEVRIVADQRTNSVIVAAPVTTLSAVTGVIAKLDAPASRAQPPHQDVVETRIVPIGGANPGLIANALEAMLAKRGNGERSAVTVVKDSTVAQKVLAAIPQPPTSRHDQELKSLLEDLASRAGAGGVRIVHLSGNEARAVGKALGQTLPPNGSQPALVVVLPPRAGEVPATASKPGTTAR